MPKRYVHYDDHKVYKHVHYNVHKIKWKKQNLRNLTIGGLMER
jgi:predicted acetyltransferase